MTEENKNIQKTNEGTFRAFERITESMGWLQIVASPLLIGLIVGSIIYFPNQTTTSLFLGITVTITGLIIGVFWATKQWKEPGTIWFMSRIISTPKLDNEDEKINNDKQTMMTNKKASANN